MNALYDKARAAMASWTSRGLSGPIDMLSDTIRCALVAPTYAPDLANHGFYSDLGTNVIGAGRGTDQILAGKTVSQAGVFGANKTTFPAVPGGSTVQFVVLYKDAGADSISPLIAFFDTMIGLPVATSGLDVVVNWDTGAGKIFKP